ncbi:Kinase-related protein of unknown function [Forsythia ovata]|uniref:GBF-interacting protein 1 N-terminal domain-containing protein n=1 Tax=Forsythia ovata TaxID=205694 RepID=A0ABD1WDK2_9LAMI
MSSGGKGAAGRATMIPSSVKKTIENIKEITGQSHSEEEIYAMLKECSMDPNETAQKLLLQDTFHEVKRKRDRRKENLNKESTESRWKPGVQTWVNRGGQGNYSSRYMSRDGGRGRNSAGRKENATSKISEKGSSPAPLPKSQDAKSNETTSVARPITDVANGPSRITSPSTSAVPDAYASGGRGVNQSKATGNTSLGKSEGPPVDANRNPTTALGLRDIYGHQILNSSNRGTSLSSAPSSGVRLSSSDPVFVPSQDSCLASSLGTIKHEVENQCIPVEQMADTSVEGKSVSATEVGSSIEEKMPSNCQGAEKNNLLESPQTASSSTLGGSSISSPSSNFNNRPQAIGPPKVGTVKEWIPKSASSSVTPGSGSIAPFEVPRVPVESHTTLQLTTNVLASKDVTLELQRKLDDSHISDNQHVIIPSHLHVPEAEKLGFCFGSFDASFGLDASCIDAPESDENPCLSKSSEAVEETAEEQSSSNKNESVAAEETEREYPDHSQSSSHGPRNFPSSDGEVSSSVSPEYSESKQEVAPGNHQHPLAHSSSNYGFGFLPPILSSHLAPLESSESQARDVPKISGFAQQSFDLTSYYAQFYRPGADSDGHTSPFHSTGAATKYNGNAAVVSSQISVSPQEDGVPLVLSTAAPTSVGTQASGVMQNSITATQQPLPVFRQPTGVHLPHYPQNYFPYSPYLSPFYVPQPAIHQFLSNGAFPQQPQVGSVYPTPPGAAAKYSISQYKQGPNTGNVAHIGMPGSYGTYGLSMPNYASSSATITDNLTSSDDLAPQFRENINVSGQQGEGSSLWFTTPSRDISTLQASSIYNLPQGQLAFAPTQPGHGVFTGIFHSAQPVSSATIHPLLQQSQAITTPIDMMGPTASVHQQAQLN